MTEYPKKFEIPEYKIHNDFELSGAIAFNTCHNLFSTALLERASVGEIEHRAKAIFYKHAEEDFKEVDKEVTEHGLLNPDSWDNKQAGFFDMEKYFKELAKAISNHILNGLE